MSSTQTLSTFSIPQHKMENEEKKELQAEAPKPIRPGNAQGHLALTLKHRRKKKR